MSPFLRYTLLRVLVIVVVALPLYALGLRGPLLLAAAVLLGAVVAYLVLAGPRRRMVDDLAARRERTGDRPARGGRTGRDADADAEDAAAEAAASEAAERGGRQEP